MITIAPTERQDVTLELYAPSAPVSIILDGITGAEWRHAGEFVTAQVSAGVSRIDIEWNE